MKNGVCTLDTLKLLLVHEDFFFLNLIANYLSQSILKTSITRLRIFYITIQEQVKIFFKKIETIQNMY